MTQERPHPTTRRAVAIIVVVAVGVVLAGCGSDSPGATAGSTKNAFVLTEWSIKPPAGDLTAGKIRVTAMNAGSETHELVIVAAHAGVALPTKADGSIDEDKIPASDKVGEIADITAGRTTTKDLDLPAGDYIAFCNLVETMSSGMGSGSGMTNGNGMGSGRDHVHYALGMATTFTVI